MIFKQLFTVLLLMGTMGFTCLQGQTIRFQNSLRGGLAVATNGFNLNNQTTFVNTAGGNRMSSTSDLVLPPNSTIVKALLYVEGYAGVINNVKFGYPGSGGLQVYNTASPGFIANPSTGSYSQFILDVTDIIPNDAYTSSVVAGGNPNTEGQYAAGDPNPYDSGNYGYGWSLFVVYTNANGNYRNVTIADQCVTYGIGTTSDILVPNITVPAIGPIGAMVVATGCWGDPGALYRDNMRFGEAGNQVALRDPVTGANNDILNGTIGFSVPNNVTDDGVAGMVTGNFVARNPYQGFGGTQGSAMYYDCDMMDASGILNPNPNPINVVITQAGQGSDALGVGTYGVSVDVAAAVLTKSISPSVIPSGGTATYTFTIDNNRAGAIDLTGIGFEDIIPAGLEIANPNCVSVTGGTGGNVVANPGTNNFTLSNLDLLAGDVCTITLCVTNKPGMLNPDCANNPAAFTNGFLNIQNNTENLANAVTDQCLVILGNPTPGFEATEVCFGEATQFIDTSKAVPTTNIVRWDWDFGTTPASSSTQQNPAFVFPAPGDYTVKLIIESSDGKIDSVENVVRVKALPQISLTAPAQICEGDTAQFIASGADIFDWSGSNLSANNIANPTANPTSTGTYDLEITESTTQCVKDTTFTLVVNELPEPEIDGTLELCAGDATLLQGSGGTSYLWLSGNETSDQIQVSPTSNTLYQLIATDNNGCRDTTEAEVLVSQPLNSGPDFNGAVCNNETEFDLNQFRNGPSNPDGGTWAALPGQGFGTGGINRNSGILDASNKNPGVYDVAYILDPNNACPEDTAILALTVLDTPSVVLQPIPVVCEGEAFQVDYNINGSANSFDVYFRVNNNSLPQNVAAGAHSFTLPGDGDKALRIDSIVANSTPKCTSVPAVLDTGFVNIPPSLQVLSSNCNPAGTQVEVILQFENGDAATYELQVDGAVVPLNDTIFVTPGAHTFSLTDVAGCDPISTVNFSKGCNCTSDPGTMVSATDTVEVCVGDVYFAPHNSDEFLDGNDAFSFILHDAPGTSPGNIITQFSVNDTFSFTGAMSPNTVYYISALVGDDDGNGVPDTDAANGCTQCSPGTPVIWYDLPQVNVGVNPNAYCEAVQGNLGFNFTKGQEPFSVNWNENGVPHGEETGLQQNDSRQLLQHAAGTVTIDSLEITDAKGCQTLVDTVINAIVNDSVQAVLDSIVCAPDEQSYELYLTIFDGTGNYRVVDVVNGTTQNSSGQFATNANFPSTSAYNLEITDPNQCNTIVISGAHTCDCRSVAPDMDETSVTQEFCASSTATVSVTDNGGVPQGYSGDANDTWSYVLCTDPSDPKSSWIQGAISSTPSFTFSDYPSLLNDVVYFITPIAGDEDPNNPGIVDFENALLCPTYFKPGTPVIWLSDPMLQISSTEDELCQGENFPLTVELTTPKAADFNIQFVNAGNSTAVQTSVLDGTTTLNFNLLTDPNAVVNVVLNASAPSFVTNTGETCTGTWDGIPVDVDVYPSPEIAFSGNVNPEICEGEVFEAEISVQGMGSISFDWSEGNDVPTTAGQSSLDLSSNALAPGGHLFTINAVETVLSNGKVCQGTVGTPSSLQLNVTANPEIVDLSLSQEAICLGDSVLLTIATTGGQGGNEVFDGFGNGFNANPTYQSNYLSPNTDTLCSYTLISDQSTSDAPGNLNGGKCVTDYTNNPQEIALTVHPLPQVNIQSSGVDICSGEMGDIVLESNSDNPAVNFNIQRFGPAGLRSFSVANVANGNNYEVGVNPADTGYYYITSAIDAAGCMADLAQTDTAIVVVHQNPVVAIQTPDLFSCPPMVQQLTSDFDGSTNDICLWTLPNGSQINTCSPQNIVHENAGLYPYQLEIVTQYGCRGADQVQLEVFPNPDADFGVYDEPTILQSDAKIRDLSSMAIAYEYHALGDVYLDQEPEITFPNADTGTYAVTQIVESINGCRDTLTQNVFVKFATAVYLPSAFSPDGDGINDVFAPVLTGVDYQNYTFEIFDRWGNRIFISKEITNGWDGTFQGKAVKPGMYAVKLRYDEAGSYKGVSFLGSVMVLR